MPDLPLISDPQAVTPEWLTAVLRRGGVDHGARILGFEREVVGTGQMGRNVRFDLRWDDAAAELPPTVVCKFPSDNPTSRATGAAQGAYAKEIRFYQELADTVDIRTPRCFLAEIADNGGDFIMVMEDLAPALQGDQLAGCTPDQAALALEEAAKLHAPRWGDLSLHALTFVSHPGLEGALLLEAFYGSVFPGFVARYSARLPADALGVAERLGRSLAHWSRGAAGPLTVTHGDYRLDNMLFGSDAGGYPLAVVDWQTVAHGYALADAAYFMGAGLLTEDRRKHEADLIRAYWDQLRARGVEGYAWDDCWRDYRRFTFGGVIMAVVASMIVEQTDRGDDMFMAMATRHATHALDLDAEEFLRARS
jgi:hypothetical protein